MASTKRNRAALGVAMALLIVAGLVWPVVSAGSGAAATPRLKQEPPRWAVPAGSEQWVLTGVVRPAAGHPRLESSLNQLLAEHRRAGLAAARGFAAEHGLAVTDDRVEVVLVSQPEAVAGLKKEVQSRGGQVQAESGGLLQALLPLTALEEMADQPGVVRIREPRRGFPLAAPAAASAPGKPNVTSEGVAASNAAAWHTAGVTGSGVRLAVVDAGFEGYAGLQGSDLPVTVGTYDWTGEGMGGTEHGTANAEIAYDMAPGASLDLHKIDTDVELGQAVNQAITDTVDVISLSLGWILGGPGDGTGALADMVNQARSNGIFFSSAAGNMAEVSWSGMYQNYAVGEDNFHAWDGGNGWLNFLGPGGDYCYNYDAGTPIAAGLHWDDWSAVTQDYDLLLVRWPQLGNLVYLVAASANPQDGGAGQTPEEFVSATASGEDCYAFVVARRKATRDVCLRLMVAPALGHLSYWTPERSLSFPADAAGAVAVAAVDVAAPFAREAYSSQGPTLGAGGACTGGGTKPDLAAYDNVSTVTYGAGAFGGTSPAAPHVAGAAALVWEANPGYSADQVQDLIEKRAVDLGTPGQDPLHGWGRLSLGAPPGAENTPPQLSGVPDQVVPQDGNSDNAVDLWGYAGDLESTDGELVFSIDNTPDPNAGVSIDGNRYIDIAPVAGWTGETDVTVRVTDPGTLSSTDTFKVTVQAATPSKLYLPMVTRNLRTSLLFLDDFSDSGSGWTAYDEDFGQIGYLNGEYRLLVKEAHANVLGIPGLSLPANYRVEVSARQVSSIAGSYVVMFGIGSNDSSYETYQFGVLPGAQEYYLEKRSLSGTWTVLIENTSHSAILSGTATNDLAVERVGSATRLYVNGTQVATTTDGDFTGPGRDAGLRAYSYDEAPVDVRFDNFAVYRLP